MWEESDETLAYIAGYTSEGVPYGVTWEEWDELYDEGYPGGNIHNKDTNRLAIADKDLPF